MPQIVGRGRPIFSGATGRGALHRFQTVDDVLAVLDAGDQAAEGLVALVNDAGATFLAPIEADLAGILCHTGDIESHLAIISRDFRIPALMGFAFTDVDADHPVDGTLVEIDLDAGTLSLIESEVTP